MPKVRSRLTIALLFTALALLAYFGTVLLSGPIAFLYRDAPGLSTARSIAQIAVLLAVVGLFIAGFIVAIPTALQPSSWLRKLLYILPVYLLGFTLAGVIAMLLGVGTVGTLLNIEGVGPVTLATAWLAVGGVLSTVAVVIASARAQWSSNTIRPAMIFTSAAGVLSVMAAATLLASVAIVSTSEPASFGPGGAFPPDRQEEAPNQVGPQQPAATPEATPALSEGQQPGASSEAPAGAPFDQDGGPRGENPEQAIGERPDGQFPPDGPGGRVQTDFVGRFAIGGGLTAVLAVIAIVAVASVWLGTRGQSFDAGEEIASDSSGAYGHEIGRALITGVALTVVLLAVSQIVPVAHDNPPVLTAINWDSPQTQDLVYRACMDCHSNETTWPWYAYIAPSSWLTTLHVAGARQELNLSELDNLPAFRRANLAENMANQIRAGTMPPPDYLLMHPDARLSDAEKQQLIDGLENSLGASSG